MIDEEIELLYAKHINFTLICINFQIYDLFDTFYNLNSQLI